MLYIIKIWTKLVTLDTAPVMKFVKQLKSKRLLSFFMITFNFQSKYQYNFKALFKIIGINLFLTELMN